jgi:hypothetical protein
MVINNTIWKKKNWIRKLDQEIGSTSSTPVSVPGTENWITRLELKLAHDLGAFSGTLGGAIYGPY